MVTSKGGKGMEYVHSILWRNYNQATIDTLKGKSAGQYDIRLGSKSAFLDFFEGLPQENPTDLGGYDINITIEKVEDENAVVICDEKKLTVRFMGDRSKRKDWNIPSQRPETAYPMWIQEGRFPGVADEGSYVILVRTTTGKFYGRILLSGEVKNLPQRLNDAIEKNKDSGVYKLDAVSASSEAEKVYRRLLAYKNLLLYGPPGTGKTTVIKEVVNIFNHGGISSITFDENKQTDYFSDATMIGDSKSMWTTFHQSYSYEEFVIGIATENSSTKLLEIAPKQGKLLEAAEYARNPKRRSLLVIDELNRANVSKVFGEFITLIEPEKRLDEDGKVTPSTVGIELPYIKAGEKMEFIKDGESFSVSNPYYMPCHLYTIASMNSVDKSIFPLDSALRRRFYRYDLYPDIELLADHLGVNGLKLVDTYVAGGKDSTAKSVCVIACALLNKLNYKISLYLGRDYTLGHSYFWNLRLENDVDSAAELFKEILFEQVFPQLEELFRGREDQMMHILKVGDGTMTEPYTEIVASDEDVEMGAIDTFIQNPGITAREIVEWANKLVSAGIDE